MSTPARILVVGGSVATGALVSQLRADGYAGSIGVIEPDPDAPYDRPPLSKDFLSAEGSKPDAPWWDDRCEVIRGTAVGLEVVTSTVTVRRDDGSEEGHSADHVVIATGSFPIRLPNLPDGVAHLRTAADAREVRQRASKGGSTLILGAGTIGTELASSLVSAGSEVTVVDMADRALDRFLGGHLAPQVADWVQSGGVDLHLGTRVSAIHEHRGHWTVDTDAGDFKAGLVVSVVGTRPTTGWLDGSDLDVTDGVLCDADGAALTSGARVHSNIHAIGDASRWSAASGDAVRFQDWTTAQRQGRHVARRLLGLEPPHEFASERAYFWSHQFGRRIQVLGTPDRAATLTCHRDEPAKRSAFYTLESSGNTSACIAINAPREFALAMRESLRVSR